jgi:hypothetical protein
MSKKRFSEGLDDLFSDNKVSMGGLFGNEPVLVAAPIERKSGSKNFMSDLDTLLQEAMEESFEKHENQRSDNTIPSNKSKSAARETHSSLPHGLDALIRETIDIQEITTDESNGKRRITVAVDKTKVEQLKTIARLENAYLKDLLIGLIDAYIEEYNKERE